MSDGIRLILAPMDFSRRGYIIWGGGIVLTLQVADGSVDVRCLID